MRPELPTPTELQEKIAPILVECYRAKRAFTKDEIAAIKEATGNPEVKLTIYRDSELPNGKWRYTRQRDAEKILALTIWIRAQETAVKAAKLAVTTDAEVIVPAKRTKRKPVTETEPDTPVIAPESSAPPALESEPLPKTPRAKTARPKAQIAAPVETAKASTPPAILDQTRLEAEALPVTQTPLNSIPTPKPKQETASQNTITAPDPSTQGQLSLW